MIFMSCTLLIRACMDSMTDTEKRIADYLLIHGSDAMHMNAKELAVSCDTSPAAVVRFAKKLGFKGFTALKLDLARESAQAAPDAFNSAILENDDLAAIIRKAEKTHQRNTSLTYQMLNIATLQAAIDALCGARRVFLYGVGASGLLAMDFQYKCSRIGIPAFYQMDSHTSLASAALLDEQDAVIAISYSGVTRETLLAAQNARACGAKVIAVTQGNLNPLARLADFPLCIPSEESTLRIGAMTSRNSGLLVLDLLYLGCVQRNSPQSQQSLEKTRALIHELRNNCFSRRIRWINAKKVAFFRQKQKTL